MGSRNRRLEDNRSGLRLENGSRIAVIGGGPAGSFFSYFALQAAQRLGLQVQLDIFEPRDFSRRGPGNCNMCGGIISETLVQNLASEGINLPSDIIQRRIDSYFLHMDAGSVLISRGGSSDLPAVELQQL
jgi:flavin-dependent dehydrogenase